MITGPSWESLGSETVITLARGSPRMLILLGRDISKIQPVIDEVGKINRDISTKFVEIHLDLLSSVRKAAQQVLEDASIPKIDVLINNAGIMACPYLKTEDGIERQFATNHIGHFLLANLIMPKLMAASPSPRIVNVSSFGNVLSDVLEDPTFDDGKEYNSFISYGQSKTANILFAVGLNERLGEKGVKAFALDPGSEWSWERIQYIRLTQCMCTNQPSTFYDPRNNEGGNGGDLSKWSCDAAKKDVSARLLDINPCCNRSNFVR